MPVDLDKDAGLLQGLAEEVRGKTVQLLDDTGSEELLWTPPGLSNHILWHAGHAVWVQDLLCIEAITSKSELPAGWYETFSNKCRPPAETTVWPTREDVRRQLVDQLPRLLDAIGTLRLADLGGFPRTERLGRKRTLWNAITHGFHDEAIHQGEMYLMMKLKRKGAM